MINNIDLHIRPRKTYTWEEFLQQTPDYSIGLDGAVLGGPKRDLKNKHLNFDHHDNVIRSATMSTSMQIEFAIKDNLFRYFRKDAQTKYPVYINDCDQDVALAVWLLENHKLFEGTQSIPNISRLVNITNKLDITGGGYPMNLDDSLLAKHNWIFQPYNDLRKTGELARAGKVIMRNNIEAVMGRITQHMMGQSQEAPLDTRHKIYYQSDQFTIAHEIGGADARYYLFSQGMDAFVNLIAIRPDGNNVWTIGKRVAYNPFPIQKLYTAFNKAEGLTQRNGWNGSDTIGGSSRKYGSKLGWEEIKNITQKVLEKYS